MRCRENPFGAACASHPCNRRHHRDALLTVAEQRQRGIGDPRNSMPPGAVDGHRNGNRAQQTRGASEHPFRLQILVAVPLVAMSEPIRAREREGARGSPVLEVTKVQLSILQADYCIDISLRATLFLR